MSSVRYQFGVAPFLKLRRSSSQDHEGDMDMGIGFSSFMPYTVPMLNLHFPFSGLLELRLYLQTHPSMCVLPPTKIIFLNFHIISPIVVTIYCSLDYYVTDFPLPL